MYVCLWEYRVRPGAVDLFIEHYGPEGTWAKLFRRAPGFEGTILLRDTEAEHVFVTIDTWAAEQDRIAFLEAHGADYRALDAACEVLTLSERQLGSYHV